VIEYLPMKRNEPVNTANCVGWWQQRGLGRQPMDDLMIHFSSGTIHGHGRDIIGDFELNGSMGEGDSVHIVKQYTGTWSIKVTRAVASAGA
jgi:hypothetical protein